MHSYYVVYWEGDVLAVIKAKHAIPSLKALLDWYAEKYFFDREHLSVKTIFSDNDMVEYK